MQLKKLRLKTQCFDGPCVYENGGAEEPVSEISGRNFSHMNTCLLFIFSIFHCPLPWSYIFKFAAKASGVVRVLLNGSRRDPSGSPIPAYRNDR